MTLERPSPKLLSRNLLLIFQILAMQIHSLLLTCVTLGKWSNFFKPNDVKMRWNTAFEALMSAWHILSILISVLIMRTVIKSFFLQNDSQSHQFWRRQGQSEREREFIDQGKKDNPRGRQARGNYQSGESQNRQRYKRKWRD